ncbi:caspase family protein [Methylocella silvestris]|nr:caspase family protein [Methylocella silvestris]
MLRSVLSGLLVAALTLCLGPARAAEVGARLALVVGNAQYAAPLATPANDAGLVAETLRGAGFDVTGAANLDQESLRRAFRDFLEKVSQAGPNAIVFVYLAGRGLQYEGENYFVPIDAVISREGDAALQAVRISDLTRGLAGLPLRARIVVLDAARANSYAPGGHLAGGLALVDADPGALYAFNAAPGTIAPDEPGPYGPYAQALSELLRQGGAPIDVVFSQVRLRVNEVTKGAFAPWDTANISPPLILLEAAPNAPAAVAENYAALQARPMRSFPTPGEAYAAALERDTIDGYQEFLSLYPKDPLARRVRALVAARREAITWRRAVSNNTADAYWSYMQRYPKGPHYYDARRRLTIIAAPVEPPPAFDVYDFGGLPPPPPPEYEIIDGPVVIFDAGYPPPPPPPLYFLPPPPAEFVSLPPPPPAQGFGYLPVPIPIPIPFGRYNGPAGRFDQPDFGHRGQGGPGFGGPGGGQAGGPGGQPAQPVPGQPAPGQPLPGQPTPGRPGQGGPPIHGLPGPGGLHQPPGAVAPGPGQGGAPIHGLPGPGGPHQPPGPGAPVQSQPAPAQPVPGQSGQGGPGKRGRHGQPGAVLGGPVAPTPPASPGAAAPGGAAPPPDHALPAGNNLPPLPAGGQRPRGPGGASKPGAVGTEPGAASGGGGRPQRHPGAPPAVLQPTPSDAAPGAPRPGRPGGERPASPSPQQMQQQRPQPQQMQQQRPQPQQMQQQRPQPQQMQQQRPQPQQMQQQRPQPQQMQQQRPQPSPQQQGRPAGKPPGKPGEDNHQ